jgi:hypothetical protein
VRYIVVNLYQSTCTKKHVKTYTNNPCQHVTYINLYHKQVHRPCTKPVQITCHNNLSKQPVTTYIKQPIINLYHKQVHQPCIEYVAIMHQLLINHDSSICTNIINYTPSVCANSSTTCLNHVPNMYLNQKPSSISSSKYDL